MGKDAKARSMRTVRAEWLTRRQVARIVGLDEGRVAQMDGRELHPTRRTDGSWVYDPNEVAAIAVGAGVSGTVTARAFAMFMDGRSDPEVVVATLQPARRIHEIRAEYDEMAGSLTLEKSTWGELKSLLGLTGVKDGATLATAVRTALERRFRAGFLEGRADAEDYGEVISPITGEKRKLTRS